MGGYIELTRVQLDKIARINGISCRQHKVIIDEFSQSCEGLSQTIARVKNPKIRAELRRLLISHGSENYPYSLASNACYAFEPNYPVNLRQISDPPKILYFDGDISLASKPLIALVGTRSANNYGKAQAKALVRIAKLYGVGVVSGMAKGIDTEVHTWALKSGVKQVVVLPHPLGSYPRDQQKKLGERIVAAGGLIISEYSKQDWSYHKAQFVRRNRIIAGLSLATIVVQAPSQSGALWTAKFAFGYNRLVFACIAQSNDPQFYGCMQLIDDEIATPVTKTAKQLQLQLANATGYELLNRLWDKPIDTQINNLRQKLADWDDELAYKLAHKVLLGVNTPAKLQQEFAHIQINDINLKISELSAAGIVQRDTQGRLNIAS